MAWQDVAPMEERVRFVVEAAREEKGITALGREFGISRKADDTRHAVYFGELLVGYLDARTPGSLQPAVPRPPAAPGPAPAAAV
jgi:hypothetical protein